MGKLYVVPTPVGNLKDITLRAIEVLQSVDLILAEDTRTTGFLLKHYNIDKPVSSHHKFNEHRTVDRVINEINSGKNIALVSDAGTPGISDPGYLIVRRCIDNDIEVETLPGATSFVPALINSGLPIHNFCFEGFLPVKKGRNKKMESLAEESRTMVFFESPYRLVASLELMASFWGEDRQACVSRELSKLYEENKRGSLRELIDYYTGKQPKGEIVITVSGKQ